MKKLNTYIFAIALAATATSIPALGATPEIRIDSVRHVVILPAIEGGVDVAVSMIDRRISTPDTVTTIASQLLLQSDLRGHVEDAAWYLRAPAEEALPAADALMLTQGWTRYDIPAVIAGTVNDSLPYPLEIGAQLDGVIRSKWRGKPLAGVTANVLAPRMADGASAVTDSLGRFHITGLEWPDSTFFVISAMNSKGKLEENIHPEFDSFPFVPALPEGQSVAETFSAPDDDPDSWDNYVSRLNSSPQGMQISLREVVVRATRRKKEGNNAIDILATMNIRIDENKDITTYEEAVANIPGVNVASDRLLYHQTPVAVWVDGRYLGCSEGKERGGGSNSRNVPQIKKIGDAESTTDTPIDSKGYKRPNLSDIRKYAEELGKAAVDDKDYYDIGLLTNKLTLIELENMYPYRENESVSYIPPHLSMLFRQGAINDGDILSRTNGGILSITTKNPGKLKATLSPEFKAVMPLGYQKPRKFYVPKYTPEGVAEEQAGATLRWLPSVDLSRPLELPLPPDMSWSDVSISIEGLTPQGSIVVL